MQPPPLGAVAMAAPGAPDDTRRRTATPFVKAAAGSVGGLMEALCLQPMDVVKTRLQLDTQRQYRGIRDCLVQTSEREGTAALWKGLTPFAAHLSLKYMLRMGTNAFYQNALRDERGELSARARLAAGFGAGVTEALVVVTPFENVKIKLQQQRGSGPGLRYSGPLQCAAAVVREQGVRGLWAGATPTVWRNGTNQMCMFWAKNRADGLLWGKLDGDGTVLHPLQSMASGALAATLGPVATGPFDVVKTRLMVRHAPPHAHICTRSLSDSPCAGAGQSARRCAEVPWHGARHRAHCARGGRAGVVERTPAAPAAHPARPGHHLGVCRPGHRRLRKPMTAESGRAQSGRRRTVARAL